MVANELASGPESNSRRGPQNLELECAICRIVVGKGEGFLYDMTDRRGLRLYAVAHAGDCEAELETHIKNKPKVTT